MYRSFFDALVRGVTTLEETPDETDNLATGYLELVIGRYDAKMYN